MTAREELHPPTTARDPLRKRLDLALLSSGLAVTGLGWLALLSATRWSLSAALPARQGACIALGVALALLAQRLDYRWLRRLTPVIYLVGLGLVAAVLAVGHSAKGAQRWLPLGPLGAFQPSELMKLVLVVALARLLSSSPRCGFKHLLAAWALTGLPFALIAAQPDLGTALVLVATCALMLFVAGCSPVYLAGVATLGAAVVEYGLKEYQRARLTVFLNPEADPMGAGYSLNQARMAIGSGGIFGQGLFAGPMTGNGFIPENWTDFIFTAIGEELGLAGGLGLLLLAGLMLSLVLRSAHRAPDRFGALLATGIASMLSFQYAVNLGMTMGVCPVVGIPLPLVSYGGTAMLVNWLALGLASSVWVQSLLVRAEPEPEPQARPGERLPLPRTDLPLAG